MYRFKMSVAYYEIMALDVARVEYDKEGKPKVADEESIRLNQESLRKAREKRENKEWTETTLSQLNTNT